ncbi:MAG TPA: peptide chain release factor N(5)-glutamine methyltransferase [Syntrophales bacterium]|nr:peptide chain release factor N(5)-glutamine methyltransferase [Syntrophales bacterium]
MKIFDAVKEAIKVLARSGSATPKLDAEVLLSLVLKKDRARLHIDHNQELSEEDIREFMRCVERRSSGEPVAYIVGEKEFWSLPFFVNRHVLIPRPETEILVEETLRICSGIKGLDLKILEIGTGSGAISIALAHELPGAKITATDMSQDALDVAIKNARINNVETQISFLQGDLYKPVSGRVDIIVSNPPYIPKEEYDSLPRGVRDFEPEAALLAGDDGTAFHRAIIEGSGNHLKPGGWLLMEIGAGQKDRVEFMLNQSNLYDSIAFKADYAGMVRVSIARRAMIGG